MTTGTLWPAPFTAEAPGSLKSLPHSTARGFAPLRVIESAPGFSTVTWKVHTAPVWALQITRVVPAPKNEPDAGLQLTTGMTSPPSPVDWVPQSPAWPG